MAPPSFLGLPDEVLTEIASRAVETAADPMWVLNSMRVIHSDLRDRVCRFPIVGRRIPLESALPCLDIPLRDDLIARTLAVENPDARFISAARVVFHSGSLFPPVQGLEALVREGHELAVFVLAMVLFRGNGGLVDDRRAMEFLHRVDGVFVRGDVRIWASRRCVRLCQRFFGILWRDVFSGFNLPAPPPPPPLRPLYPCAGIAEGWCRTDVYEDGWQRWGFFCSEECRIRHLCPDVHRTLGHAL